MQIISIYVFYKFYDAQIQTIILYLTEFLDKCNCTLYKVLVENAEKVSMCDTWGSLITHTLLNYLFHSFVAGIANTISSCKIELFH